MMFFKRLYCYFKGHLWGTYRCDNWRDKDRTPKNVVAICTRCLSTQVCYEFEYPEEDK